MSIAAILKDRIERGMLHLLTPRAAGEAIRRVMVISDRLYSVLHSPTGAPEWEQRVGALQADLEIFVSSAQIHPSYLFQLYPRSKAVWEIRSVQDNPSIRVFGLFAQKDVFVATNFALRSDLGGWESAEWKQARRNATVEWMGLFHQFKPLRHNSIHALVTGAIDGKYFKDPPAI
jgi:hypothetical protein